MAITREEINNKLRAAEHLLPTLGHRAAAEAAFNMIADSDKDEALILLLMNQMSNVLALGRKPFAPRSYAPKNNSVAAIRDSGIDPAEADKRLGYFDPIAHRVWARSKANKITRAEARAEIDIEDQQWREQLKEKTRIAAQEIAEIERKAEIAELLDRVVMVRGIHKNLLQCTLDEVEWLADQALNRATANIEAAGFYLNVANRMKERNASTVSDIAPILA